MIESYVNSAMDGNRDCRLLVPGLTEEIGSQVHEYLKEKLPKIVNTYLVIGENQLPNETDGLIKPIGLTSKRIGSFVAIVNPGQLAHIQDSIRGSGGTIRSLAFSEEWPWIDDGNESFRFDGPVLNELVKEWSNKSEEQEWLRKLTIEGLLKYTRSSSLRANILLEDILGNFSPELYPDITDVKRKFLYHSGIPCPNGPLPSVEDLIKKSSGLSKKIVERCQKDEDIRDQARDTICEIIPENDRDVARQALDCFLDGLGRSTVLDLGLLSFHDCWGNDRNDTSNWNCLDADLLADLFKVRPRNEAKVDYTISCQRGLIDDDHKKVATFFGEQLDLQVNYEISSEKFSKEKWIVLVLNRQKKIIETNLTEDHGQVILHLDTASITSDYSRKVPLRLAVASNNVIHADVKLDLHLCGENRPAFVVIERSFDVLNAEMVNEEEIPDKKIILEEPVHVFLFEHGMKEVTISDEDGEKINLIKTRCAGVWKSAQHVDAATNPSGQVTWKCKFDDISAVICFETSDLQRGEFTIEDEFRTLIANPDSKEKHLKHLFNLFKGKSHEPYPVLGKINEAARRRIHLAKITINPEGWRPLLTNLFEKDQKNWGTIGNYINYLGKVEEDRFSTLTLPEGALLHIRDYINARNAVINEIESNLDIEGINYEHPIYASSPIFIQEKSSLIEKLLSNYLGAYNKILTYIRDSNKDLTWHQVFTLTYLDCVVHWQETSLKNSFFLLGPWHPLVVAKRFMIQSTLYNRAQRLYENEGGEFRQLTSLLGQVQGFRWIPSLSIRDIKFKHAFVCTTSDPGWHFAFQIDNPESINKEEIIKNNLWTILGLLTESDPVRNQNLPITALSSYLRSFPSRRSIGIRVRHGYTSNEVVREVSSYLHDEEGPSFQGTKLPGGVRLSFENQLNGEINATWSNPSLSIYHYENDDECVRETVPDIYMSPLTRDVVFRESSKNDVLPRGLGYNSVFYEPLRWIAKGQTPMPNSVIYEFDSPRTKTAGIGGSFLDILENINKILVRPTERVSSINLPDKLRAPWVVIPGSSLDPAILVTYVHESVTKPDEERALWDYNLDVTGQAKSFFILSSIPKGFEIAVNGFFKKSQIAEKFIVELGEIGIAIGGEALKSGRHALGIIGLVGAVRMLTGKTAGGKACLINKKGHVAFLIPVDSFGSFFGNNSMTDGRRSDLLAIQIVFPDKDSGKIQISACGIESKFVSGTFLRESVNAALEQGRTTVNEFKKLVVASLCEDAIPERLALLELVKFGMRITSPKNSGENENWVSTERIIYQSILSGEYEYHDAKYLSILTSTEGNLQGVATYETIQGTGMWIRLTRNHWPDVSNSPQLENVRQELCTLFNTITTPEISPPYQIIGTSVSESGMPVSAVPLNIPVNSSPNCEPPKPAAIEIPLQPDTDKKDARLQKIFIGVDDARGSKYFDPQSPIDPLENLNMMVTGSSGYGKTQFLKYLICKLREQGKNVLILDLKKDFADDKAFCERARLERVFVNFKGLPYNPLIPYPVQDPETNELVLQCSQYIAGVSSVLKQTYGLGVQQQAAVNNAIKASFLASHIPVTGSTPFSKELKFPDFSDVGNTLQQDNLSAYNRLDPLFTLGLFRSEFREQSFKALVNRSVVLDLSSVPSDEIKNALAQLIVLSAHSYYNTQSHSGTIRQFLIFDEGHRVLKSNYMLQLVRECRAYGVGTILSSQYPSDFKSDISASMATKVLHGNGSEEEKVKDILQLLGCAGREEQLEQVTNLKRFQAFIDNRHNHQTLIRTMNYPSYLIWTKILESGSATRDDLAHIDGINPSMLSIGNLINQLELMGLVEEKEEKVVAIKHTDF